MVIKSYIKKIKSYFLILSLKETVKLIQPLLISEVLKYFEGLIDLKIALAYSIIISSTVILNSLLMHPYFLNILLIGMKLRIAVSGIIYKKVAFFKI